MKKNILLFILILPLSLSAQLNSSLQSLAGEFWRWRAIHQPATMDDIPRVERPDGWAPDFSAESLVRIKNNYFRFSSLLAELDKKDWSRADSVDFLSLRSAVERVNWEVNILRSPYRNPDFYIQQTLGAFYELLVMDIPFDSLRVRNLFAVLRSIPKTISDGKINLSDPSAPFARIALENLGSIEAKLEKVNLELKKEIGKNFHPELELLFQNAASSFRDYEKYLKERLHLMKSDFSIGKKDYLYFLKNIALIPYSPDEMLKLGRIEFERAVLFESLEKMRNKYRPKQEIFGSSEDQIRQAELDETEIRNFLESNGIVTIPAWLKHYALRKTPAYLAPITFIGESDDFTSEHRLNMNAVRYIVSPDSNLSFFPFSIAKDPRPVIIHEGIPGHYFQMALSWSNPDPIRRRFIDSGANEGIGFYVEEMLLQMGLFDERPHAKELIYSFMRLRALRVEADINLSLGNFSIDQTAEYLERTVPMDRKFSKESAFFYAYNPGQAISYQIGKIQLIKFLSEARIALGGKFSIRDFHDYIMLNGNIPISLLRWEYLGLRDEINQFFDN